MLLFFMAREKKSLPSSSSQAFEKRGGTVQPRGQARSEAGDSLEPFLDARGRVRSSLVPTSVHLMVLAPTLKVASWAPLCCPYSFGRGYQSLPEENVCGLHKLMYQILS